MSSDDPTVEELNRMRVEMASSPGLPLSNPGQFFHGFAPEGGWTPEDFPQISVALIAYTSNPMLRPDPHISIRADDWMYIEAGNVRFAIPDRREWAKLVHMGEALWNTHEREMAQTPEASPDVQQ